MLSKIFKLKQKLSQLSWSELVEVLLHPVLIPLHLLVAWPKSLWASRILLWAQWSQYHGFHVHNAINSLFYRTQWINLNRYGRLYNSPIIGLGNFPLSNWWHLSSIASYFYAYAGAVTTLLGTLFLTVSHLLWLQSADWEWVIIVTAVLFFSSTTYAMAFSRQNYQILAWMFVPIGLFGLLNGQWIVGAIAFFMAAMLGVTAFVVCIYLVVCYALYTSNYQMLWLMLPAMLVVSVKFFPLLIKGNLRESFLNLGKLIGLIHVKVRYKRGSMKLGLFNLYFLFLCSISLGLIWYAKQEVPIFLLLATTLFLINQRFARFADDQSMMLTVAMTAVVEVLILPFNWLSLFGLVVVLNPILNFLQAGKYSTPKIFTPFSTNSILQELSVFLKVPTNERIYFAFNDPLGKYENVFDGYRVLLEAPLVVAAEKNIHLFPDWYAVMETNYEGAPSIWGRSITAVLKNLMYWKASYAIIYQDAGTEIACDWLEEFEVISEFDWTLALNTDAMLQLVPKPLIPSKWWLLKLKIPLNPLAAPHTCVER